VDVSLSMIMLIGLSTVLLMLDWRLGLVMTIPVPLLCWFIYQHGERMNRVFLRAWRKWSRVTDVLSDTIPGIKVVKAFNQEEREIERFDERNETVTEEFNRIHKMWTTFWPLLMLAVHATTVTIWVFALPRLLGDGAPLSAGTFVSFLLYTTMFVASDRGDRADGADDEPCHQFGASRVRGAGQRDLKCVTCRSRSSSNR
jgi:ATP-binding cassette subfamily B protein